MSAGGDVPERSNPFATRFVRPGAIEFRFEEGQSATALVARLAALGWRAQIVGPHGSGKSTLLASLAGPLEHAGRKPYVVLLRDGQRRMPRGWAGAARREGAGIIVVDGYEQLGLLGRWRLAFRSWREGWGLLVTAHREAGFDTLCRTEARMSLAQAIVADLLPPGDATIGPHAVADAFAACGSNLRETLFVLYDQYEAQRTRR